MTPELPALGLYVLSPHPFGFFFETRLFCVALDVLELAL